MATSSLHSDEVPQKINILTLNCWGLKFLAKYRRERLLEIGRRLARADDPPDIVGLQECWTQEDYNNIRKETRHILPYGKFYFSGIFGGGLAILSKWPIEESSMFAYPLNGRPTAFFRGDWFVGKGVACAKVRYGPAQHDIAEVFCTHLHAPYEKEPHDSYICHRTAQAWEIAKLMRGAAERGHLVIGLGDFNMLPLSLAHRLITLHAPVQDVWRYLHPDSSLGAAIDPVEMKRKRPVPTADYNILENGATCDGVFNTWRWSKQQQKRLRTEGPVPVDGSVPDPRGKRLDYIFVGQGQPPTSRWKWTIESARVGMMERHPTLHCSLSDHFAVEATLRRETHPPRGSDGDDADADLESGEENTPFLPIQKHIESSVRSSRHASVAVFHPTAPLSPIPDRSTISTPRSPSVATNVNDLAALYDQILAMIDSYVARERFQRRFRVAHFLLSIVVSIGCFVAMWWSPRAFVSFILCLVSTLSFAAGLLDGLIGGFFVSSELRALKEFEWEVHNARKLVLGMGLDIERDLTSPK
ncbi:hypothetical protein VTO42DRAFT_1505 [Malbranchea cinnamomea]